MARKAPVLFFLLALVLAGAAAWGAHRWVRSQAELAARQGVKLAPVVVAARSVPAGRRLTTADLRLAHWPAASLPRGHFSSLRAVQGRVVRAPLYRGEVVLASKLAPKGLAGGLSAVVPAGFRAMTVKVDEVIGVAGFVQPGDRVDVLVTLERGPYRDDPVTRIVLEDVKVLTVGGKLEEKAKSGRPRRHKASVVTLQLTPQQAETLALAATTGKLLLALRNRADDRRPTTAGVRLTALAPPQVVSTATGSEEKPVPQVEVIRGTQRSQQSLESPTAPGKAPRRSVVAQAVGGMGGMRWSVAGSR
jgi:pilus assembly protein CpaB